MDMVPRNSTLGGFAHIWQSKWVGIIAVKTERMQIHFLSDILFAVASLDLKVPKLYLEYLGWGSLSKYVTLANAGNHSFISSHTKYAHSFAKKEQTQQDLMICNK